MYFQSLPASYWNRVTASFKILQHQLSTNRFIWKLRNRFQICQDRVKIENKPCRRLPTLLPGTLFWPHASPIPDQAGSEPDTTKAKNTNKIQYNKFYELTANKSKHISYTSLENDLYHKPLEKATARWKQRTNEEKVTALRQPRS